MARTSFRWLLAMVVGAAVLYPITAQAEIVERIVAVVNERIVLLSELNTRVREYLPKLAQIRDPKVRRQQLRLLQRRELVKLVDAILIEGEGKKRKLKVSNADVDKAIQTVLRQNKLTLKELIATLAQEGYPFASYREDLRKQILRLKTINLAVRSRISVSWTEVRAHYQKSVARMGVGLKLKLSQIFLRVDRSATGRYSLANQRRRARRLAQQLRSGKVTIGALARRVSDDPETRSRGGSLGYVGQGSLPPQVETAVFAVKGAKKVVGPIHTDSGLYIVYIHARKESEALPFDKIKRRLKARLSRLRAAKRTAAWVKTLRQKALIDIRM
jgi:peptidyl-prolyl cis-trans isomerase SurA